VVVSRLRVVSPGDDALAVQLRVSNLLGASWLEPSGLPPSAIVVIRKLVDPLPGRLPLRGLAGRPPLVWEQAVSAAIDRLVRRAARPALGAVPADAQAVIFVDISEWLACLAADWLKGLVASRWWWRDLLRRVDPGRALLSAWLAAPESVPAALRHLADRRQVVDFARALTDDFARALIDAVVLRFGLSRVREALDRVEETPSDGPHRESETQVEGSPARPRISSQAAYGPGSPPRLARAPEGASAGLGLPARALLGIGLTLARATAEARTPSFAHALHRWLAAISHHETGYAAGVDHEFIAEEPRPGSTMTSGVDVKAGDGPSESFTADAEPSAADAAPPAASDSPAAAASVPPPVSEPEGLGRAEDGDPGSSGPDIRPLIEEVRAPILSEDDGPMVVPVVTEFGGLFFLINLAVFLGLYGDFSTPAEPGIALDLWDFVALVGLRLVGEPLRVDPVWPLLARLAVRDEWEPPGQDFDPGNEWRLPPEWLAAFPKPSDWVWDYNGDRLRVRHAEGFLVLDVPLGAGAVECRLEEEMRAYPAVQLRPGHVPSAEAEGPPVERWLDRLLPYVRTRLARALGASETESVGWTLCQARARIFVTADRLDVMLPLQEHPIAIRLAGLDRDPGWVPAAGRFVAFHFE